MVIYLAAPIDHVADRISEVQYSRSVAKRFLIESGVAVYDPAAPFHGPMNHPEGCYRINEAARREAEALLALLPPGVPTTGTPMEIVRSHDEGKPVAVIGGDGSMQLDGMGVYRHDWPKNAFQPVIAEAVVWLKEQRRLRDSYCIRWTGPPEQEPKKGYPGDAGFDLIVSEDTRVHIDHFVDVPCGINVELPHDCWAMITGRSSTLRKRRLLVSQGIIDQGYRGPIFAGVWNMGEDVVHLKKGERIAQLIPFPLVSTRLNFERVASLGESVRGVQAFGSTGE